MRDERKPFLQSSSRYSSAPSPEPDILQPEGHYLTDGPGWLRLKIVFIHCDKRPALMKTDWVECRLNSMRSVLIGLRLKYARY